MALPDLTFDEATRPGGTGHVITFYKLDCLKCGTLNFGDDLYTDWREGQQVTCQCGFSELPETRKVDLAA